MNRVPNKIRPALHDAPYWRLYSLKKYTISRYIANHHIFTVQTLSYQNTSPIHKFILQGQHITQRSQQNAMCPVRKTPHSPKTLTPSYAQILGGADSVGHGGHVPPTFTNGWARGHRELKSSKQETGQTTDRHESAHQND